MAKEAQQILVVEDEPALLQMIQDVLDMFDLASTGAGTPEQARAAAASAKPALFLIDLMLPGLSGVELASEFQARGFADIPMIAMSASDLMLEVATRSGVFRGSIRKPFEVDDLIHCIQECLSQTNSPEGGKSGE